MGWRGQHNRDVDEEREWRSRPLRVRYDWTGIAIVVGMTGAIAALMWAFR